MLKIPKERINGLSGNLNKEIVSIIKDINTIKKNQKEMKKTLEGMYSVAG